MDEKQINQGPRCRRKDQRDGRDVTQHRARGYAQYSLRKVRTVKDEILEDLVGSRNDGARWNHLCTLLLNEYVRLVRIRSVVRSRLELDSTSTSKNWKFLERLGGILATATHHPTVHGK